MSQLKEKVKVINDLGLHTRPAAMIVRILQNSPSDVFFTHKRETINAKSILSILMLAAKKNSRITITVDGGDSEQASSTMGELVAAFEHGFGEIE